MASLYYYTARDGRGAFIRGSIQASDSSSALGALRARALFVTSLEGENGSRGMAAAVLQFGGPSRTSLAAFFRAFHALARAGVPMRRSLEVSVAQCADARLREALRSVLADIENGLALSDAMSRRPNDFPHLHVAMIRAGEIGGVLDEVLERIAGVLERERATRKRLAAALTYPAFVACAALGLIAFLLVSIVPMFASMFEQLHVPLPPVTAALIAFGTALRSPAVWIAAAAVLTTIAFAVKRRRVTESGALFWESFLFSLPLAGVIAKKIAVARFARTLGAMLASGVTLVAALDVVAGVVGSVRYRASITEARRALGDGSLLAQPLERSALYEPMFVQMLKVGEETGSLDAMLLRAADYYDLDVETSLGALASALEPAMILLLGGAVGFIVAAIFVPLYTLIGNMK